MLMWLTLQVKVWYSHCVQFFEISGLEMISFSPFIWGKDMHFFTLKFFTSMAFVTPLTEIEFVYTNEEWSL